LFAHFETNRSIVCTLLVKKLLTIKVLRTIDFDSRNFNC